MAVALKALLASALLLAPAQAIPQTTETSPVPKVVCIQAKGYSAGSAFRIGPTFLLTARHVITTGKCQIEGQPVKVVYASAKSDFAILEDTRGGKAIPVDCDGFKEGGHYVAVGHARAMDDLTVVPLIGTASHDGPWAVLVGIFEVQPGQSGGPIVDAETLKVVGVVNAADWESGKSFSVELKGTSICGAA